MFDVYHIGSLLDQAVREEHTVGDDTARSRVDDEDLEMLIREVVRANTMIWHLEDIARDLIKKDSPNKKLIINLKLAIDSENLDRVRGVAAVDEWITQDIENEVFHEDEWPVPTIHTETVGWIIDRLSILALKRWHLLKNYSDSNSNVYSECIALLDEHWYDLLKSLTELHTNLYAGKVVCKTYGAVREKMFDDDENIKLEPCIIQEIIDGQSER